MGRKGVKRYKQGDFKWVGRVLIRMKVRRKEMQVGRLIGQFRYFKIQLKTIDIITRLWGINPTNSIVYSPQPRAEVYCLKLNINISKLGYYIFLYPRPIKF